MASEGFEARAVRLPAMRQSSYNLFVRDEDGGVLAVNLLTRAAMKLSPHVFEMLEQWGRTSIPSDLSAEERAFADYLQHNLFLVDDAFDELGYVRRRTREARFESRQLSLVICPTMGCNFSCHYCFEDNKDVSLDAASRARVLALVADRVGTFDGLGVRWFGGEPLEAIDVIESLSAALQQMASEHGFSYAADIVTNAYHMDAATARRLRDHGVRRAQVTLDGDRPLHDRTRREHGSDGSFDRILANIVTAPEDLEINVRVHVAPFSYDSVVALLDTLDTEGMQPHIARLYFAPLYDYHAGMTSPAYGTDGRRFATSEEFAAMQVPLLEKAHRLGFRLDDFLDVSYGICTAVRNDTLLIDAEGHLMKCYKDCGVPSEAFGDLDGGVEAPENLQKWLGVEIPRDEECRACKFLPVCLGGCSKQWQKGADKSVICTPLKFNHEDRLRIHFRDAVAGGSSERTGASGARTARRAPARGG